MLSHWPWQVLRYKFRVRMCVAASKLLNTFMMNGDLLVLMHIVNTRIMMLLEDRPPIAALQVSERRGM